MPHNDTIIAYQCFYFEVVHGAWYYVSQPDITVETTALKYYKDVEKGKIECFALDSDAYLQVIGSKWPNIATYLILLILFHFHRLYMICLVLYNFLLYIES